MSTLETLINALERSTTSEDQLTVWLISFVRPGPSGPIEQAPKAYIGGDGERWTRQPGETLEQLKDRASREVKRSAWGFACLRECYEATEEQYANH